MVHSVLQLEVMVVVMVMVVVHYEIWKYCQSTSRMQLKYYRISECGDGGGGGGDGDGGGGRDCEGKHVTCWMARFGKI